MKYILLPSLKHAAVVRTASLLYNDEEIENLLKEEKTTNRQWDSVEIKIADKLSPFLPPSLRNSVAKVIRPMHAQVELWKRDHEFLLEHLGVCNTWLLWKTDGTINRTQTAKKIAVNDNIDPKVRFVMACTYFLEDEILALWERIKKVRKKMKELVFEDTNTAVRFWLKRLRKKNTKLWREKIEGYMRIPHSADSPADIPLRVSCFYPFLSRETRQGFIRCLGRPSTHSDDFQLCVNNMDEIEFIQAFKSNYPFGLVHCLRWPYRSLFIKLAKEVFSYLTHSTFRQIFYFMLCGYVYDEYEDFHLFEEFWQISPPAFKYEAKNAQYRFTLIEELLEEDNCPQALKEIVRKCYLD